MAAVGFLGVREPGVREREGIAMALLLVLLLALTLLGHGTLLLARREFSASKAYLHVVRSTLAARGAVYRGIRAPPELTGPRVPGSTISMASGWTGDELWLGGSLRWLGPELFFLEGQGRSRGWPGTRAQGAVGWSLDPVTRIRDFRAGVELGGGFSMGPGAGASTADLQGLPVGWEPEDCRGFEAALGSLFSGRALPLTALLPPKDPSLTGPGSDLPPLGFLPGPELLARAPDSGLLLVAGSSRPPAQGCPGSGGTLFLGSEGELEVRGGRICGLLVVDGDLRILGEGVVQGLILVGGDLQLGGSARLEGLARVRGSVAVEDSAILRILGCPALRALSEPAVLRKPVLLPGASGISLF